MTAGRLEVLVVAGLPAQHEQRDVDDGEHAQQQQRGGAAEQRESTAPSSEAFAGRRR